MSMKERTWLCVAVALALLSASCGSDAPFTEVESSQSSTSSSVTTTSVVDAPEESSSSTSQDSAVEVELDVVACSDAELEEGGFTDSVDHLLSTDSWWEVTTADIGSFDTSAGFSYVTMEAVRVETGEAAQLNVRVLSSSRDFFAFALESPDAFFLGLDESPAPLAEDRDIDGGAAITFVERADGSPFVGGSCDMRILDEDLQSNVDPDGLVETLLSLTGIDLATAIFPDQIDQAS